MPKRDAGAMVWKILTNPEKKARLKRIIARWDDMYEQLLADHKISAIKERESEDETTLRRLAFRSLLEQVLGIQVDLKDIKGVPENPLPHIDAEHFKADV